jgi:hypothetical protein
MVELISSCPPTGALVARPTAPTPSAVIAPPTVRLPPTAPWTLMPKVWLPSTLIVPLSTRAPVIAPVLSIRMPVELSPSTVMEPPESLVTEPSSVPLVTQIPIRFVPVAHGPPAIPVLPASGAW